MLVLRRQEELGGQIYLQIVRKHIFIAISGRSGGREGRVGPGGGLPTFLQLSVFLKKELLLTAENEHPACGIRPAPAGRPAPRRPSHYFTGNPPNRSF